MNLISRTIPALIIGLSALTLSTTGQANPGGNSSFSFSFSNGYQAPHARPAYRNYYRPPARAHGPRYQPPAHASSTYIEKRIYNYSGSSGGHGASYGGGYGARYRGGHGGYSGNPGHSGYAGNGHY